MTAAVPHGQFARPRAADGWRMSLVALAGAWAALLLLFRDDVAGLTHIWWTSTTFGHCLFVGPVIAWLVWQRRAGLAELTPVGWWPGLALVALGGIGWLMGAAASTAIARHLGLILMLQGAVLTVLGPNVARGMLFPLAYMLFLVPFGESLEGPLQGVTVAMCMSLLHLFGVPASVDGVLITIPNGYFEVAEACSGAKFVIAMVAFGVLVANVCYVSWGRRAAFLAMALVVPVFANGLRAFGTIYAAYWTSVAAATGFDHIVYGWIFFGLVMAAVLAIGWRWFDRDPDAAWFDPATLQAMPRRRIDARVGAGLVMAVALAFVGWAAAIASRTDALPANPALPEVPGWHRVPLDATAPWQPYHPGADRALVGRYADDAGDAVQLSIALYGSQREGKELVSFGTGVLRENGVWVRVRDLPDLAGGSVMEITHPGPVERQVATWYRVGDVLTASESVVKLETLKARLLGGRQCAAAIHLSAVELPGHDAGAAMRRFLQALGPVDRFADREAGVTG